MRVRLSQKNLEILVDALKNQGYSRIELSKKFKVSVRTISDWFRGRISMQRVIFDKLVRIARLNISNLVPMYLPDFWYTKNAGIKGGLVRNAIYGNPGTSKGRSKGGLHSIEVQKNNASKFKNLKKIKYPIHSADLAEFFGIISGDGHVAEYQVTVTTNSETDYEHAIHCQRLFKKLFNLSAHIRKKKDCKAVEIVGSSRALVEYFHKNGIPSGNKIKNEIGVPDWVNANPEYQKAFIRGLFDTDGCVYLDKHTINKKDYYHLGWTITNFADNLISGTQKILRELGFSPTHRESQPSVYLRRQNEIIRYFTEVRTSNPKHQGRYEYYIAGGVPKRS